MASCSSQVSTFRSGRWHVSCRAVPKPPSQTWRTFLQNHLADLVAVDFLVVPTATFRVLYVFVVLLHHRRRVVRFNVTETPSGSLDRAADRRGVPP